MIRETNRTHSGNGIPVSVHYPCCVVAKSMLFCFFFFAFFNYEAHSSVNNLASAVENQLRTIVQQWSKKKEINLLPGVWCWSETTSTRHSSSWQFSYSFVFLVERMYNHFRNRLFNRETKAQVTYPTRPCSLLVGCINVRLFIFQQS